MGNLHMTLAHRQGLDAFQRGLAALDKADAGDRAAVEDALQCFRICLEWITPENWLHLWAETQIGLADAYLLRPSGEPLMNASIAAMCYRAALIAYLADHLPTEHSIKTENGA